MVACGQLVSLSLSKKGVIFIDIQIIMLLFSGGTFLINLLNFIIKLIKEMTKNSSPHR